MTQPTVSKTSILSVMSPWSHLARVTGGVVSTAVKGHLWPSHSLTCSSGWWHIWRPRNSPWGSGAECPSSSGSAVPYRWSLNGGTERREVSGGEESGWKERLRESEEKMSGEREYRKMRRDERGGGYNREEESLKSIVEAIGFSSQKNPCRTQWFHPTIVRVSHISVTHTLDSRKDSKLQFSEKGKKKKYHQTKTTHIPEEKHTVHTPITMSYRLQQLTHKHTHAYTGCVKRGVSQKSWRHRLTQSILCECERGERAADVLLYIARKKKKRDLQSENLSLYSLNEVSVDQKQIWVVMTSLSSGSSCCTSITGNQNFTSYSKRHHGNIH